MVMHDYKWMTICNRAITRNFTKDKGRLVISFFFFLWVCRWNNAQLTSNLELGLQRYTVAPVNCDIFLTIQISKFEWDITVLQNNKLFLFKNQKLLYQHSEIIGTVLISLMTPYLSTSLFFATGLCCCL